jgi:hypothetical protein
VNASFSEVGVLPIKRRWLSNEQKTALSKHVLQQASSAVKDKLKKDTVYHIGSRQLWRIWKSEIDPLRNEECENLKLER